MEGTIKDNCNNNTLQESHCGKNNFTNLYRDNDTERKLYIGFNSTLQICIVANAESKCSEIESQEQ